MDYSQKSLTKDGLLMLSESDADGTSLVIDKMIVSQQTIDSTIDLKYLTLADFTSPMEFDVNSIQKNDDSFQVKAAVANNTAGNVLNSDYKISLIGVVAHTSTDTTDKLLGVIVGKDPFILPTYNNVPVSYIVGVTFGYSNVGNITIQIKNDVYALSVDAVHDNHDGKITVNNVTFTPADDSKVVHDNHDGSIEVNGKSYVPANDADLSKLRTDFDNQEIGGTNLLPGTSDQLQTKTDCTGWGSTFGLIPTGADQPGDYYLRVWIEGLSHDAAAIAKIVDPQTGMNVVKNQFGSKVKAGASGYSVLKIALSSGTSIGSVWISFNEWQTDTSSISWKSWKLERGSVPTDWSPAPQDKADKTDVTQALNQANAYADTGLAKKADDATTVHTDSPIVNGTLHEGADMNSETTAGIYYSNTGVKNGPLVKSQICIMWKVSTGMSNGSSFTLQELTTAYLDKAVRIKWSGSDWSTWSDTGWVKAATSLPSGNVYTRIKDGAAYVRFDQVSFTTGQIGDLNLGPHNNSQLANYSDKVVFIPEFKNATSLIFDIHDTILKIKLTTAWSATDSYLNGDYLIGFAN